MAPFSVPRTTVSLLAGPLTATAVTGAEVPCLEIVLSLRPMNPAPLTNFPEIKQRGVSASAASATTVGGPPLLTEYCSNLPSMVLAASTCPSDEKVSQRAVFDRVAGCSHRRFILPKAVA